MYLGPPCYDYSLNYRLVLFDYSRDTSVMHEKAKFVCFIYIQPQKSIQICSNQHKTGLIEDLT